jgi:hypothetical protein
MKNVMTVESLSTDCRVAERSGALDLTGPELRRGQTATAAFATAAGNPVSVRIGSAEYRLQTMNVEVVPGPAATPHFGVTTVACAFHSQGDTGDLVIVVDCGREPPHVSITARHDTGAIRSWAWAIDHAIQHTLLTHLRVS